MRLRTPKPSRTDTPFPDTTLFRSDKDTVDFAENYDGSRREPTVLPARFPNLLVNGAGGIAVGMATNIPPHNLGEVIDGCLAYIDNPGIRSEEHTSELQSLMRISYAVFCLKKKNHQITLTHTT